MTTVGTYIGDAIREGRNEFLLYLMRKTWQKLVMNMFGTCFAVPPKLLHATSSRITSKLPLDRKSVFYLQNLASADSWRHWPPKHRYRSIRKERERETGIWPLKKKNVKLWTIYLVCSWNWIFRHMFGFLPRMRSASLSDPAFGNLFQMGHSRPLFL